MLSYTFYLAMVFGSGQKNFESNSKSISANPQTGFQLVVGRGLIFADLLERISKISENRMVPKKFSFVDLLERIFQGFSITTKYK